MAFEWELDNPAIALSQYYKYTVDYAEKKRESDKKKKEIFAKQNELIALNTELDEATNTLTSMDSYDEHDAERMLQESIQKVKDDAQKKIESEKRKFEAKKKRNEDKRDLEIQENDAWVREQISELKGKNPSANREFTEIEKKAVDFEFVRRQFITESDAKISQYQEEINQETLSCQNAVMELKNNMDELPEKYAPDIEKYKKIIDSINEKHQPNISACQSVVTEKVANRDVKIGQLQKEKEGEIQLAKNEISRLKKDFWRTKLQFDEQIRIAKLQNKPTTRMENSKTSRLNEITDKVQKIESKSNRKVLSIDQAIETETIKHAKGIEKAEGQLNEAVKLREQELLQPVTTYNGLIQERDSKISALKTQISQREHECNTKVENNNNAIQRERKAQTNCNRDVDEQIVKYVMSKDNCFSNVLNEQNAMFTKLQGRVNTWMEMVHCITKEKMTLKYPIEHEKQKKILSEKKYEELQSEVTEATQYNDELSFLTKNKKVLIIIGSSITALGVVLLCILLFALKSISSIIGILLIVGGIILIAKTISKSRNELSLICKYVSLASDYKEFPCISLHSTKITQDIELAKMKVLGRTLYDAYYARVEIEDMHRAKCSEIKSDYEQNLKLITDEFENSRVQIERGCKDEIKRMKGYAVEGVKDFNSRKKIIQNKVQSLTKSVEKLNSEIFGLNEIINENEDFLNVFENNYSIFENQLENSKWVAPMSHTYGKLSDLLYIVPGNKETDNFGHRKVYRVNHNKKASVINYDISNVVERRVEDINKIICDLMFDLMYAVYRMNSRDTYVQFVVDGMAATNDLKRTNVRNAFNICEIVGNIEDIKGRLKAFSLKREMIAEKGITIDIINEKKSKDQERPETYNILYIIFKPDESTNELNNDIRMLIPECEKYGFLPIFICEKETWEKGIHQKDSIYKDIKGLANSEIIVFDGKTYLIAD